MCGLGLNKRVIRQSCSHPELASKMMVMLCGAKEPESQINARALRAAFNQCRNEWVSWRNSTLTILSTIEEQTEARYRKRGELRIMNKNVRITCLVRQHYL